MRIRDPLYTLVVVGIVVLAIVVLLTFDLVTVS